MIDEDRTLSVLGVDVSTLTYYSNKMVFRVCEDCGIYDLIRYGSHRFIHCRLCANRDLDRCKKVSNSLIEKWKNETHFNTGRELTDEHKEKLRVANTGYKNPMFGICGENAPCYGRCGELHPMFGKHHSEESRHKTSESMRGLMAGEKHPNWKGGITEWQETLRHTQAYKNWRHAVFERDDFTCQMCFDNTGGNLQAHHIEPIRDHKNDLLLLDINNGITLCKECHASVNKREHEFVGYFGAILGGGKIDYTTK